MDYGAMINGYHSDMTRTIVIGKADADMKKLYKTVLDAQLAAIDAFSSLDTENLSNAQLSYAALEYLMKNCSVSGGSLDNTAYSALVRGEANSEGVAFAYVELCRQLGVFYRLCTAKGA